MKPYAMHKQLTISDTEMGSALGGLKQGCPRPRIPTEVFRLFPGTLGDY